MRLSTTPQLDDAFFEATKKVRWAPLTTKVSGFPSKIQLARAIDDLLTLLR